MRIDVLEVVFFFFFNDTATTEIYTLSLHDALPILKALLLRPRHALARSCTSARGLPRSADRKSTRLNSSHTVISYAVFCLKKKKKRNTIYIRLHRDLAVWSLSLCPLHRGNASQDIH